MSFNYRRLEEALDAAERQRDPRGPQPIDYVLLGAAAAVLVVAAILGAVRIFG